MARPLIDPSPTAVLFDLDDTLCDYAGARLTRLQIAFSRGIGDVDHTDSEIDLDRLIAESIQMHPHGTDHFGELFARFGIDDAAAADVAAAWYQENKLHSLALFPDTRRILEAVQTAQFPDGQSARRIIGIITNGPIDIQRAKIERLKLHDLIDFAVISEEFGAAKPEPAIFHEALALAQTLADDALFVGDSIEFDMAGAHAAGIRSVWVNRTDAAWTESDWKPDYEIRSLEELPGLLDGEC